jgi:hypothetical protein
MAESVGQVCNGGGFSNDGCLDGIPKQGTRALDGSLEVGIIHDSNKQAWCQQAPA